MYRLYKSRGILIHCYRAYVMRKRLLVPHQAKEFKKLALEAQDGILTSDREKADHYVRLLQTFTKDHLKRTPLLRFVEGFVAVVAALLIAVIIRQTAFEPYEIPSGSMRPTSKSKTGSLFQKLNLELTFP